MGRHDAQAGRDRDRGDGRRLAQAGRGQHRVRRPAVRGLDRQGGLRDPEPLRRRDPRDHGAGGRDGAGGYASGPDRSTGLDAERRERRPACRRGRVGRGGEAVRVGAPRVRIGAPASTPSGGTAGPLAVVAGWGGAGFPAEAVPGTAGSGGPSLNDPAAPQMGGSEAMPALEDPGVGVPSGVGHEITMPKLRETGTEGTIGSWKKQVGDTVSFDDPLFEVSTDKVDSEIPSPYDGVLLEILVPEGETVPVGEILARIGEPGASGGGAAVSGSGPAAVGAPAAPAGGPVSGGTPTGGAVPAAGGRGGRLLSPPVRRLVARAGAGRPAGTRPRR